MTTREEYAEAAEIAEGRARSGRKLDAMLGPRDPESSKQITRVDELMTRVLRALADGAALCEKIDNPQYGQIDILLSVYAPLKEQP